MPILNYTTSIESSKTIMEIMDKLAKAGAGSIMTKYDSEKLPTGLSFSLTINNTFVSFQLPANPEGVLKAMQKSGKVPRSKCTKEQALRVSWRILKDWVEAQLAIVEAQLADLAEVFLPYAVTNNRNTVYEQIKGGDMKLLN